MTFQVVGGKAILVESRDGGGQAATVLAKRSVIYPRSNCV